MKTVKITTYYEDGQYCWQLAKENIKEYKKVSSTTIKEWEALNVLIDAQQTILREIDTEIFFPDEFSCPGCGCLPGQGKTPQCNHEDGCGFNK